MFAVTFERTLGFGADVQPTTEELMAIAAQLESRGHRELGQRVRKLALGGADGTTIVLSDVDVPALVAAVEVVGESLRLTDGWAGVRDL